MALAGLGLVVLAGCGGGGQVGTSVRRPAAERPDVEQSVAASGAMALPADASFNITSFKSGQDGNARGEAKPVGNNGAACVADVQGNGSAWGEFQLGYCFDNTSGAPLNAKVKLHLNVNEGNALQNSGAQPAAAKTTTANSLRFFIKDTNGVILKEETLVSGSMEKGPNTTGGKHDLFFGARFEPQRGYYLVIAGRTEAHSNNGASANTSLEVTECALEITWGAADES